MTHDEFLKSLDETKVIISESTYKYLLECERKLTQAREYITSQRVLEEDHESV